MKTAVIRLKKSAKKKWVAALRSGEYKQGIGYLKRNDRYCCLGVAREVLGLRKSRTHEYLSKQSLQRIGLSSFEEDKLSDKNDCGQSFARIADYIDKYL
jgi:hypothetical protein